MHRPQENWRRTTHDWSRDVDRDHLESIRRQPARFADTSALHLVLEVLAYAADEAEELGGGRAVVTVSGDVSVAVTDRGRGTDTRVDDQGRTVKKPVMATKDLRFFDAVEPELLPDERPRRGMSVVAALSTWLEHTNRRREGSWTQRYEQGVPVTDLIPVADDNTTGTLVQFQPDPALVAGLPPLSDVSWRLINEFKPRLLADLAPVR